MNPWLIRVYRWCEACHEKACNDHDIYCPSCTAEIDIVAEEMNYG